MREAFPVEMKSPPHAHARDINREDDTAEQRRNQELSRVGHPNNWQCKKSPDRPK